MTIAKTLDRISADLKAAVAEDEIDREAINLAARRLAAQAEMVSEGLVDV
jgi:hypothetical protein